MKTLKDYVKLVEDASAEPALRAVGVSEPEPVSDDKQVEVEIEYGQDFEGNPTKTVWARAGGEYLPGTNADKLREILKSIDIPLPDEDFDRQNKSGINVSIDADGRITSYAENEAADKFLEMLADAGIKVPAHNDQGDEAQVDEATDAEVNEVVRLAKEIRK